MRLLNQLCYYKPKKEVIKNKGKKKLLMTKKLIEWGKKSKWGFSINNVITRSKKEVIKNNGKKKLLREAVISVLADFVR